MKKILIHPVSAVHDRNVALFRQALPEYGFKCIYNPHVPWFSDKKESREEGIHFFTGRLFPKVPAEAFEDVSAVLLFTAQPRVPVCNLVEEATLRRIPVIAVEEVYLMMLSQGAMNNYLLPVDHLFAASDYERERFIEAGIPQNVVETTGGIFRNPRPKTSYGPDTDALKKELGISSGKSVVTLSLDVLAPSGETLDMRKKLLECISKGLPHRYELLVKPHPSDQHEGLEDFVKEHAPRAILAAKGLVIDKVLDVTDILFNRGTSQVILDALDRDVPVGCIPFGRKTSFHGLVDEVIVSGRHDVKKALTVIESKGMDLYKPLMAKHLYIKPEDALLKVSSRIREIIESRDIHDPEGRLLELALYWAWLGYGARGLGTLELIAKTDDRTAIVNAARRMISCKADREDLALLKKWAGKGYREWVVQSLWIRVLCNTRSIMDDSDIEWLSDFPPMTNAHQFMPFVRMLDWRFADTAGAVVNKKIDYWRMRADNKIKSLVKNAAFRCGL